MARKLDIRSLIDRTQEYLPSDSLALIEDAYEFTTGKLQEIQGESADVELEHALRTAITVAELQLDANCIAAALLHGLPEKYGVNLADIGKHFGADVGKLIEELAKLEKVTFLMEKKPKKAFDSEAQAESLRAPSYRPGDRGNICTGSASLGHYANKVAA